MTPPFNLIDTGHPRSRGIRRKADAIISNTYRTLMRRGTKACFVFACDPELNEYLKRAVAGGGEEQPASVYL